MVMMKEVGYVLYGIYVLLSAWLLANAVVQVWLWILAKKRKRKTAGLLPAKLPFVTIQAPVYNEKYVVEGLLDSLASLDYPKDLLEILVLDDSTDETSAIINNKAAALIEGGVQIRVIRRKERTEYKAGALQASLPLCRGELVAVFDADFRPQPSFLKQLLPHFGDSKVGLVQARWGHLNREQNFLTRIQAFLLDTYFSVEQQGRSNGGFFTNFCGTAGIWRKQCIDDAGGWDGKVLSEDLDLSYRAQLRGWKLVYESGAEVPAELPSAAEAFKIQQFRWTKGIMQVCRKNLASVLKAPLSLRQKLQSVFHLSGSFVFPCLFFSSFLSLPLLLLRQAYPEFIALTNYTAIGGLNLLLLTGVFYYGTQSTGKDTQFARYYPVFLLVYMGMSVQNTVAVLQGLFGRTSAFIRTPKFAANKGTATAYLPRKVNAVHVLEVTLLLYYLCGISLCLYFGDMYFFILFVMMFCGTGLLVWQTHFGEREVFRFSWPKFDLR